MHFALVLPKLLDGSNIIIKTGVILGQNVLASIAYQFTGFAGPKQIPGPEVYQSVRYRSIVTNAIHYI